MAQSGFSVDAWDIAPTAVVEARKVVSEAPESAAARVTVSEQDFFAANAESAGAYDLIWDCTFLCAIPKAMREAWAARQHALLKPGGTLVSLVFPVFDDDHPKVMSGSGPPFALNASIVRALLEPHGLVVDEGASVASLPEAEQHLPGRMSGVRSGMLVFIKPTASSSE